MFTFICVTEILELQREALVVFFPGIQLITERGAVVLLVHMNYVTHVSRYAAFFRQTHPVLVLALLFKLNTTKHGFRLRPGGQMYFPVISHSMSGTLIPIFGRFTIFNCPFSFSILLFREDLSELQPYLRNAGNSVSECSILKISWGHAPRPPYCRCLQLQRSQRTLQHQDKFHARCFHNHVRYFTKLLKTLTRYDSILLVAYYPTHQLMRSN